MEWGSLLIKLASELLNYQEKWPYRLLIEKVMKEKSSIE
jgi:hypothetical protein